MEQFKFDEKGLLPAIIQDAENGEILMLGYMDEEAIKRTLEKGRACFYSRSRKKYWVKGETSGHVQNVKEILMDCDKDALLIKVEQVGGACHEGYRTCFYRKLDKKGDVEKITQEKVFNPDEKYSK